MTDAIKGIRRAARKRERAEEARRDAMVELREWVVQARADAVPLSAIAREAGLSRQGVYDLLRDQPPS